MENKGKRIYWLKLHEDFFSGKEIKKLRNIAGGDTYTIIYLKLMLLSLEDDGIIYYDGVGDTFYEEIALQIDEDIENVKVTLIFLEKVGLLNIISESEVFMPEVKDSVGSETPKAQLMRRLRESRRNEQIEQNGNNVTNLLPKNEENGNNVVTKSNGAVTQEKEKTEKEEKKEKNQKKEENKKPKESKESLLSPPIVPLKEDCANPQESTTPVDPYKESRKEIIAYLNSKIGTHYKPNTEATVRHIKARMDEGYTVEDFKTVIDIKVNEWIGTSQAIYLRPDTLFRPSHFESYLNQQHVDQTSLQHTERFGRNSPVTSRDDSFWDSIDANVEKRREGR